MPFLPSLSRRFIPRGLIYTRGHSLCPFNRIATGRRLVSNDQRITNASLEPTSYSIDDMESISDDDDFPFSQEDAAALLALEAQSTNSTSKREFDDSNGPQIRSKKTSIKTYPTTSPAAVDLLRRSFGLDGFQLKQEAVISRLLAGGSAVVVFPTGGGKSLCYQLPALLLEEQDKLEKVRGDGQHGVSLIVSPLIALMKDQVDALVRRGINARCLDSTKTKEEVAETHEMLNNGSLRLLYCAPERLNNEGFVSRMHRVRGGVRMVAVDEAHCISEWGHAFRPDYLKVARFVDEIQAERVIALTATAMPEVAEDIRNAFNIDKEGIFRTSTYRSNLQILADSALSKKELYPRLFSFLRENPGSTIVYVTLQKQTVQLAEDLRAQGFQAEPFHAGLDTATKTNLQNRFMKSNNLIMVATIAFGMGIDKNSIRNVVHFNIPSSIESYSQEIGRAGRDGKLSKCMFYICGEDLHLREMFARSDLPSKQSVQHLLEDIFDPTNTSLKVNESLKASHYEQSRRFDIRPTTLSNIYAQLELRWKYLRAITPEYSKYEYKANPQYYSAIEDDRSASVAAIRSSAGKAKIKYHIDVDVAARAANSSGVNRFDIIRKLNDWNDSRIIELTASGVLNVYRVLKKLPSTAEEITEIVDDLYSLMEEREAQALLRADHVLNLITSSKCFSKSLAEHFGDDLPDRISECGHCTWCMKHKPVLRPDPPPVKFNTTAFNAILDTVDDRDDPRFLARIAFGISSPRITALRLGRNQNSIFSSMEDHDFTTILNAFTRKCNEDIQNPNRKPTTTAAAAAAPPARVKSNYTKTGGGSSRGYSTSSRGSSRGRGAYRRS